MPLVFLAYLALLVGLVLGSVAPTVGLAVGAGVSLFAIVSRDWRASGLALTAIAGVLATIAADRADAACRRRAFDAGAADAIVDDAVRGGGRVSAMVAACALRLTVAVARGHADAGDVVRVSGEFVPGARGALVRDATIAPLGGRAPLVAWRADIGRTIDDLFGDDAPLVRALVVADASSLPIELRDRYADAGLVHLLSVSGLHVSLVAVALELLFVAARLPRRAASIAAVAAVALYVAMLGAPPPAVRAGTMLGAQLATRLLQRPTSPWAVLALGGALPLLFDPRAVFDIGYQLSVAGMASLVAGGALARRIIGESVRGWRRSIARELVVGVVASSVTAPVVAWCFGRVSLVAPIANLVASPIVALLQPALFLAVVLAPVRALALHAAGAARLLARALDAVAALAASVPHASLTIAPSLVTTLLGVVASGALLAACVARRAHVRTRALGGALACVAMACWAPLAPTGSSGSIELHMIDVGQGDAVALRTPHGRWVLFDAGRTWRGGDAGVRTVVPYLRRRGGTLDAFVLSHPHADHVGGAASVLARLRPRLYWDGAFALGSDTYRASLDAARTSGASWRRVHPDDSLVVDGVALHVLAPDSAWTASLDDPNLASVIVAVRWRAVRFLLVGDAEAPEERWLVERAASDPRVADLLRADVLKVAHHGSRTSSTPPFLALVRPSLALVSVGAGNTYRLPNADVLQRLVDGGAQVVRTDQWGTIVVRSDGRRLAVEAGGEEWSVPTRADSGSSPR